MISISHIDLDGYGCTMFLRTIGMEAYYNIDYKDLKETLEKIPKTKEIIITDLSFRKDEKDIIDLLMQFKSITIIDHHETSLWLNDYKFDNAKTITIDTKRCATYLLWKHMEKSGQIKGNDWFESYAVLIDDYDRWIHANPNSMRLNSLLYISSREFFMNEALRMSAEKLLEKYKERIDRYAEQVNTYVKETQIKIICDDGIKIAIAFAEKYKSHISDYCFKNKICELIYIIDMRTGNISIRSSAESKIDCAKIAEKYLNGGGHFNASGGRLDIQELETDDSYIYIPMMPTSSKIKREG